MASQHSDVRKLNNSELIKLLKDKGYGGFEEILQDKNISGNEILTLKELEIMRWKLPASDKRRLWSYISEIQQNSYTFSKPEKPKVANKPSFSNNRKVDQNDIFKKKLEQTIGHKAPENKIVKKPVPPTPQDEEYMPMDKQPIDDDGYLTPIKKKHEIEDINYNKSPATKNINLASPRRVESPVSISNRAPQALPRESTGDGDYIAMPDPDPEPPVEYYNTEPPPPPIISRNPHIHFTPSRKAKVISPEPSPISVSEESEDPGEIYEPPPDDTSFIRHKNSPQKYFTPSRKDKVISPEPSPISVSEDAWEIYEPAPDDPSFIRHKNSPQIATVENTDTSEDTGTLSKTFIGWFIKRNDSERESKSSIKTFRDKSPTDSVRSFEQNPSFTKDICVKSRPLPPTPDSPVDDEDQEQIYENIEENNKALNKERSPSQELYVNEAPTPPLPPPPKSRQGSIRSGQVGPTNKTVLHSRSEKEKPKTQPNLTPPMRQPGSYEMYKPQSDDKKKLPVPPTSLPEISIQFPQANDEETEEYNTYTWNINDEPFYRYTDRKGARQLLDDLDDGAFLFRPSQKFFLTLSLKYKGSLINLGVEKTENNRIRLNADGDSMSPEFPTITDFIDYFSREYLTFYHKGTIAEVRLRKSLPHNR